jgi:hypothetical protein
MRRPVAEELPALEETNELLPLALGALSFAARLDELLCATMPVPGKPPGAVSSAPPDPVLAALLGLLSLRRTLSRWLAAASAEAGGAGVGDEMPRPLRQDAPGGWLR